VYACAAVSDFYIPDARMAQHKIQSRGGGGAEGGGGGLTLHLDAVPKMLGMLRASWCPRAVIVTFKLETDAALLESKAAASLRSYGQDMVVGNLLGSYRHRVWLRFASGAVMEVVSETEPVETKFVPVIVDFHKSKLNI
jgi:phosphopantothenate-cysteine ligase